LDSQWHRARDINEYMAGQDAMLTNL